MREKTPIKIFLLLDKLLHIQTLKKDATIHLEKMRKNFAFFFWQIKP